MDLLRRPGLWLGLSLWALAGLWWEQGSTRPTQTIAQPIPIAAATANPYWAGYVAASQGPYSEVQATWTVPTAACARVPGRPSTDYVWIGEGGYLRGLASHLIQAGTATDCFGGVARYHAFYEWYPGIYATDFPIAVQAGDKVTIRLVEVDPDYWIVSAHNETSGARTAIAAPFHADTGSADFIVERPNVCWNAGCEQVPLNTFSFVTFQNIQTQGPNGAVATTAANSVPIALVDPGSNRLLAVPGMTSANARSLSVLWRHGS